MPRIIVEVMPKPEILDPQGKAITSVLPRVGFEEFTAVRQGKLFEVSTDGPVTDAVLARVRELAQELLANPVTEDVTGVYAVEEA